MEESRKAFFNISPERSHTYLVYGNTNDIFCPGSYQILRLDAMLLRLLRERGYRHVVFFSGSGTKGAYTLDDESARFFFKSINAMATPSARQEKRKPKVPVVGEKVERKEQRSLRYALPGMNLAAFLTHCKPLMEDKTSSMAIVFYDLFTERIEDFNSLKEAILTIWEEDRSGKNLCLLVAPESMNDETMIAHRLKTMEIYQKFFVTKDATVGRMNPFICHRIGYPHIDEVKNLLTRMSLVGTQSNPQAIFSFVYNDLERLASEVLYCACMSGMNSLREIYWRLDNALHKQGPMALDEKTIDQIFGPSHPCAEELTEQLKKPGWENVYNEIDGIITSEKTKRNRWQKTHENDWTEHACHGYALDRFCQASNDNGYVPAIPSFVLTGSPGTGKTTVARFIGGILKEAGILSIGHTVYVTREQLTSSYVAGVPKAVTECFDKAEGGVLFIDEAHQIGAKDGGVNNEGTGGEIASTMNALMTDPDRHVCVIAAGYAEKMDAFLNLDNGLRRRFQRNIHIDDYKPELLKDILANMVKDRGFSLSEELENGELFNMVERIYHERNRTSFGNAGDMETLADIACGKPKNGIVTPECFIGIQLHDTRITSDFFASMDTRDLYEKALQRLQNECVGKEKVMAMVQKMYLKIEEAMQKNIPLGNSVVKSMVFVGNPGTGKTEVAELIADILFHFKVIGTAKLIHRSGSDFASSGYESTQMKVKKAIHEAQERNAILFVDEAHQLLTMGTEGKMALQTFMTPLSDKDKPLIVIFAVYPRCYNEFMCLDTGLKGRTTTFYFRDFTGDQLYAVFLDKMVKEGKTASEEALSRAKQTCNELYSLRDESFCNGRMIERLLEEMNDRRRQRCKDNNMPFTDHFEKEDVPCARELLDA